jgi:hypothetical protein
MEHLGLMGTPPAVSGISVVIRLEQDRMHPYGIIPSPRQRKLKFLRIFG